MSWTQVPQFDIAPSLMKNEAILKRHFGHSEFHLWEFRSKTRDAFLQQFNREASTRHFLTAESMADNLRLTKKEIALNVVNMVMRVDQTGHWSVRNFLDLRHKPLGHGGHHQRINYHRSLFVEEKTRVAHSEFAIRLNVSEDFRSDFFDPCFVSFRNDPVVHLSASTH